MKKIGEIFKKFRESRGVKLKDVAKAGISTSQLSHFEKGETDVRFLNLYLMNIFLSGLSYYFIGVLLLKHLGFSFTEIATISVITELCGSVFDIPLSFISSKFGYKKILIVSNLFLLLALSCLLLGQSKLIYISAIFFGLSESLSSGVLNAYNFELIDNEGVYQSFLKYLNTVKYIFIAIITIISPYLLNRNYIYPIMISIVFVLFSLLNVIRLPEIKNELPNDRTFFFYHLSSILRF